MAHHQQGMGWVTLYTIPNVRARVYTEDMQDIALRYTLNHGIQDPPSVPTVVQWYTYSEGPLTLPPPWIPGFLQNGSFLVTPLSGHFWRPQIHDVVISATMIS